MMLPPGSSIPRDRHRLILAVGCAVPCGIVVGLRPTTALLLVAVALGASACLLLPLRYLPAVLLAVTIVMPSLVFKGISGSGQARAVIAVLVLALLRVLMTRPRIVVPGILPLAIGATLGLTLMTALVAASRPASEVGGSGDLVRDLSFPAAAVVGFIGGASARYQNRSLSLARAVAGLALIGALLSVWYWAWHALGIPPLSSSLFDRLKATSGFATSRSIFPFVEDSPNIGAVIFVLLGAFAAPPLMLSRTPRDRTLGLIVIVSCFAAVLSTQSRTGLFAAVAAALVYLLLVGRGGGQRWTVALAVVALCGAGAAAFATFPAERASSDTLQARVQIWGQAGRAFLDYPILGHGYEYSLKGNFVEGRSLLVVSHVQSTHSDLMSELVDGGVVGAAIFIAVLGLMVSVARTSLADPASRPLGVGYSCMLAALVVGGIDNSLSQSAAVVTLEWMTFGLMVGICSGGSRRGLGLGSGLLRHHRPSLADRRATSNRVTACAA
jgi:O-antigen ligase